MRVMSTFSTTYENILFEKTIEIKACILKSTLLTALIRYV